MPAKTVVMVRQQNLKDSPSAIRVMGRKKYILDQDKIARREAEGRGRGFRKSYKPWLTVQDVPSIGRRHRTYSEVGERVAHLLSDVENNIYLMVQHAAGVYDIHEQKPLDRRETYRIACEMGVKHPKNRDGHEIVMTTDLVIFLTTNNGIKQIARAVKYDRQRLSKRDLEKLEIERRYWKARNVDWKLLTRSDVDPILIKNLNSVRAYRDLSGLIEPYQGCFTEIKEFVLRTKNKPLDEKVCAWSDDVDEVFDVPRGTSLIVIKHLLATKLIATDFCSSMQVEKRPLHMFDFREADR